MILTGHLISIGFEKSISNFAVASQKSRRMMPTPPYLKDAKNVNIPGRSLRPIPTI
jgi:hypothetical protein